MGLIVEDLNPVLRGWFNYFRYAYRTEYKSIDGFIRRRLRAVLLRRNRKGGWGKTNNAHRRWPNAYFAKLGLFTACTKPDYQCAGLDEETVDLRWTPTLGQETGELAPRRYLQAHGAYGRFPRNPQSVFCPRHQALIGPAPL
uniref:Group II intron, maturase-specific domain n=1 Tax=Candidatus Kentrum sp. SD TaxID=2126332 RepID=A0A450YB83_9GAMM|nr:MAG: Group II intron, maturase-specific domain [Candidatus Kentron sp. SD]VFK43563.1 MAG: Group II intron, maturase-specific domain [Candidatus Kentron sp. SD]